MRTYKQPGAVLTLTAPYDRNAGEGAKVGQLFGVATGNVLSGVDGEFMRNGVHTLAKVSAQAWTQGALIYWDNAAKLCTTVASGNLLIGAAASAAANPSATGDVVLAEHFRANEP
jgi:predicted RecA/RadA family phage recombinase